MSAAPTNSSRGNIVVIGGPNGAGKSTVAKAVLCNTLDIVEFVNADVIAAGLAAFDPDRAAFAAGRIMLSRLRDLAAAVPPANFAFESTLASRTFAPWLASQAARGFNIHVIYIMLRSPDLAVRRVKSRVRRGGHAVADEVVRRRFVRSAFNLFHLYIPVATRSGTSRVYDNLGATSRVVAKSVGSGAPMVTDLRRFTRLQKVAHADSEET